MPVLRCLGQDMGSWRPEDIFEVPCPYCGNDIEFFKDDAALTCRSCGSSVCSHVRSRVEGENLFLDYCQRGLPGVVCNVAMTYGAEDREPTPHGYMITLVLRGVLPAWDVRFSSVGIRDAACWFHQ